MNYSNSQRAGVILYLTALLFGGYVECAKNLGIGVSTLARWEAQFRDNDGYIPVIGSSNYASEEEREIARLRRELRDAQDDYSGGL